MPAHLLQEEVSGGLPAGPGLRVLWLPLAPSSFISAAPAVSGALLLSWRGGGGGVGIHACPCTRTHTCAHMCVCHFSVVRQSHAVLA